MNREEFIKEIEKLGIYLSTKQEEQFNVIAQNILDFK